MRDVTWCNVVWGFALAAAALVLPAVPATPAAAQNYVYSTQYCAREFDGAMDCAYFTLRQCLAAVSATGGDCAVNPRYAGEPSPRYRKAPRTGR
jgi:hypothetical protein